MSTIENEEPIRIVTVAIEDDSIFVTLASAPRNNDEMALKLRKRPPMQVSRQTLGKSYESDFTPQEAVKVVSTFFNENEFVPDAVAVSTFGVVDNQALTLNPRQHASAAEQSIEENRKRWAFQFSDHIRGIHPKYREMAVTVENDAATFAIGEYYWGACQGLREPLTLFLRVGRGINGTLVQTDPSTGEGTIIRGHLNTEAGHLYAPRLPGDDYRGSCANHVDCIEGLAGMTALRARVALFIEEGSEPEEALTRAKDIIGYYLAHICHAATALCAPSKIVVGGSLMNPDLIKITADHFSTIRGGYPDYALVRKTNFIVPATLQAAASLSGAAELARRQCLMPKAERGLTCKPRLTGKPAVQRPLS